MTSSLTMELFDLLVYLLPGLITCGVVGAWWPRATKPPWDQGPVARLAYIILLSFVLGVFAHIVGSIGASIGARMAGYYPLDRSLARFKQFDQVRLRADTLTGTTLVDAGSVYRYAETYVVEKAGRQGASVSRLIALSLFCRNSMLPVFLAGAAALWARRSNRRELPGTIAIVLAVEGLLAAGWVTYYSAAVTKVLRTFLILA